MTERACGHCGFPTMAGPPPFPGAVPLCGLCLNLSLASLSKQEVAELKRRTEAVAKRVKDLDLAALIALHRSHDKQPRSLSEAFVAFTEARLGMGRLLTLLSENGVDLPVRSSDNPEVCDE